MPRRDPRSKYPPPSTAHRLEQFVEPVAHWHNALVTRPARLWRPPGLLDLKARERIFGNHPAFEGKVYELADGDCVIMDSLGFGRLVATSPQAVPLTLLRIRVVLGTMSCVATATRRNPLYRHVRLRCASVRLLSIFV